jgi:uncharacterized protein
MIDLAPAYRKMITDILHEHVPHAKLFAFGSLTDGTAKPHSDINLLLDVEGGMPMLQRACLRMALEESDLPMRVDWMLMQEAPQYIRAQACPSNLI